LDPDLLQRGSRQGEGERDADPRHDDQSCVAVDQAMTEVGAFSLSALVR
jgi:hypothetical protein